jgi:D-glycero-alpha-D-manno-heptose-7-phosphate kinase
MVREKGYSDMLRSLRRVLAGNPLEASAPCRIDSGGTWDIKSLSLPLEGIFPTTVNVALNLRTSATLFPYEDGWVRISSEGFGGGTFPKERLPFSSAFGLFLAAISHFGFHGLEVCIKSQSPVKSALGGSSTALVALIKALAKASVALGGRRRSRKEILHLAYHLEDGMSGGNCGMQDQAAAVYGGVHQWRWRYGHPTAPFEKTALLDRKGQAELSRRLLVAYSGRRHVSLPTNQKWIRDFHSGRTRAGWIRANRIVQGLSEAIQAMDWHGAARLLRQETRLRMEITPGAFIPLTKALVNQAEQKGCGARFAGAGAGGVVWAIGEIKNIQQLRESWEKTLTPVKDAQLLCCGVDPMGVK